jgi:hypothetical protein
MELDEILNQYHSLYSQKDGIIEEAKKAENSYLSECGNLSFIKIKLKEARLSNIFSLFRNPELRKKVCSLKEEKKRLGKVVRDEFAKLLQVEAHREQVNEKAFCLAEEYASKLEFFPGTKEDYEKCVGYPVEYLKEIRKVTRINGREYDHSILFPWDEDFKNVLNPHAHELILNRVIAVVNSKIEEDSAASASLISHYQKDKTIEYGLAVRKAAKINSR